MYTMENINPKTKANWISLLLLTYTFDIFKRGAKNLWTDNNLYSPIDTHRSSQLGNQVEREWKNHLGRCRILNKSPSVKRVLLKIFWKNLCFDGCLVLLFQLTKLPEPLMIGLFLSYFSGNSELTDSRTFFNFILMISFGGLKTIIFSQMRGSSQDTAVKVRSSCNSLIFRKILRMSNSALQDKASGNILNLISNELNRLDVSVFIIHQVWTIPLSTLGIMYLLYYNIGVSGLIGIVWLILVMFLQGYFAKQIATFRKNIAKLTGERLKLMNETLSRIKTIKMYRWEKNFIQCISLSRLSELEMIKECNYFQFLLSSVAAFINITAIFAAILTMIRTESSISVAQVYSLVAYYAILNNNISQVLPSSIVKIVNLHQTFSRIETFMLSEEINLEKDCAMNSNTRRDHKIILENIYAQWVSDENQNSKFGIPENYEHHSQTEKVPLIQQRVGIIRNINLELEKEEFVGIVGQVGSGKSTLLSTLIGETFVSFGQIFVNGSLSYASQEPWIFDGTIRENILFHELFDQSRFNEVLRVCSLEKDLNLFSKKDLTQVGERGVCLSGGQKARINLARAVYKKADIYLLDDPLSSLDIQVCNYLVAECFKKFLSDKCIILVTHHLQYLQDCTKILVLDLGEIKAVGTFNDLNEKGILKDSNFKTEPEIADQIKRKTEKRNSFIKKKHIQEKVQATTKKEQRYESNYFFAYLNSGGQSNFVIIVFLLFILCQLFDTLFYLTLAYWTHNKELKQQNYSYVIQVENFSLRWNDEMHIFGNVVIALGIFSVLRGILFCRMMIRNSKILHTNMLERTIGGEIHFFLHSTSGHILSWFSKDLGIVDEILPKKILDLSIQVFSVSSRLLVVAYVNPYLLLVIGVMILVISYFLNTYRTTARNISHIEGSAMAPVLTHVNAVIKGLSTIRASNAENMNIAEFDRYQDRYLTSWFMYATVYNAFGFFMDLLTYLFISTVAISCFIMRNAIGLNGSQIGLALTQAMGLATYLQYGLLQFVQTDNSLVALERILEYEKIHQEANPAKPLKLPCGWPMSGKITFRNVNVKYDYDHPAALTNLNFTIHPSEKIGIVGRTGAGKTSIINALFRMVTYIEGTIELDDYDTSVIPLDILRSRISVIPQDADLFCASLRYNLDPFMEFDDSDLYRALKEVNLEKTGCTVRYLHDKIEENGANLSVGQKQLISLARAILRNNKIVVLDEATSNIDSVFDDLIQSTIRRNFSSSTVITIAHRISTVMDSDRIIVIDAGKIIEFDTPQKLLQNEEGTFYKMFKQRLNLINW